MVTIDESEIGGWWFDPTTSTIKDVQGRVVGTAKGASRGVFMAAAEELVRGIRQVEIIARDERLTADTRVMLISGYVANVHAQLQRDLFAALPTTAAGGRNS